MRLHVHINGPGANAAWHGERVAIVPICVTGLAVLVQNRLPAGERHDDRQTVIRLARMQIDCRGLSADPCGRRPGGRHRATTAATAATATTIGLAGRGRWLIGWCG